MAKIIVEDYDGSTVEMELQGAVEGSVYSPMSLLLEDGDGSLFNQWFEISKPPGLVRNAFLLAVAALDQMGIQSLGDEEEE